jgi:hypothetical protein
MKKNAIPRVWFVMMMFVVMCGLFISTKKNTLATQAAAPGGEPGWSPALASDNKAADNLIDQQLKAFNKGQYDKAMTLQTPGPLREFPREFQTIVETQYPELARSKSAVFQDAFVNQQGDELMIPVAITGKDGHTVQATYRIAVVDGTYLIDSIRGARHFNGPPHFSFSQPQRGTRPMFSGPF